MIVQEIHSTNVSKTASINGSKPDTPKPQIIADTSALKPTSRSMSTDVTMFRMSPRDTPSRKYFDSGDYEMARAGILSSASVGSIHACPENILSHSASGSRSRSIEEFSPNISKNQPAPNTTSLHKSIFSLSSLEE